MTNYLGVFIVTFYCHCHHCCSAQNGVTASGTVPVEGRTIAGTGKIPYGTRLYIEGIGWRVMEDRMARRMKGNRLDVYVRSHKQALKNGVRKVKVWKTTR